LEIFILLIFWIAPSFFVARYAERKGHSFVAFLVLGVVASWVISLVVATVVPDRGDVAAYTTTRPPESTSHLDDLQKLTDLRIAGTLSDDEFEAEKARILDEV
jgi:hypothetical protein